MRLVVLVVALLIACCCAQLTDDDKNTIVALHNNARANAIPVPQTPLQALVWDETIAQDAQTWVNQCKMNYSPKFYATLYGENPVIIRPYLDVNTAFNFWFQQGASYSFADGSCRDSTCMNYIQIVSNRATAIGCGVASCSFGIFFVCNYKSYGQYSGVLPYTPASGNPTNLPTSAPTAKPTSAPTPKPTAVPTSKPTSAPTSKPTSAPTTKPTAAPTSKPTSAPTSKPTSAPTSKPTSAPTQKPTTKPTQPPTVAPTVKPTSKPSGYESIDYRGTKAVLAVKDQKQCGSCWAFSTTAIIEGALGLKGMTLPLLSDQNTLDCSGGGSCSGGWPSTALSGMIKKGGINSQAAYPYKAAQGSCAYNAAANQGMITKTGQTSKGDFASIYNALLTYGPVGIAVYADNSWYSYRSGVIAADYTTVNHAVTVVGYNATLDAWIVKNSWGASWGMQGYLYLSATRPAGAQRYGAFWAQ